MTDPQIPEQNQVDTVGDFGTLDDLAVAEREVREHRLETEDPWMFLRWLFSLIGINVGGNR